MFLWIKQNKAGGDRPSGAISVADLKQGITDLKEERSRFVEEANQLLAQTEDAFADFDRGMTELKQEAKKSDQEIERNMEQVDQYLSRQ